MKGQSALRTGIVIAVLLLLVAGAAACGGSSGGSSEGSSGASDQIAAGDTVAAKWTDGDYYLATVTNVEGDSISVTYVDDGTSRAVPTADVRTIPDVTFAVGDRVLAVWSSAHFYPGEVTAVEGTTYTVKWDDGSTPSAVEAGKIIAE